jgi:hypothetical protein
MIDLYYWPTPNGHKIKSIGSLKATSRKSTNVPFTCWRRK